MIKVERTGERVNSNGGQVVVGALPSRFRSDVEADAFGVVTYSDRGKSGRVWEAYVRPPSRVGEPVAAAEVYCSSRPCLRRQGLAWVLHANRLRTRIASHLSPLCQNADLDGFQGM